MSISGIQGQLLELTVVGCHKLKNTEWIARQDPYVCIEYGSSKFRTRTCTDGGKNPTFQEKFVLKLVEGLQELIVVVWNSNTLTYDDFIGNGKIQLHKALANGYDDSSWPLQDKKGRHSGDIKLIMHYSNKPDKSLGDALSAPPHLPTAAPHIPHGSAPLPVVPYPQRDIPEPAPYHQRSIPEPAPYHQKNIPEPAPYPSYPPNPAEYPMSPYYQPATYPPAYPPESVYPPHSTYPPHTTYPPPAQDPNFYPPGPYPPAPYPPAF